MICTLFTDYKKDKMIATKIIAKTLWEAGQKAEEIIDGYSQEEREKIYCFTLRNNKAETIGRFRPHRYNNNIVFGFYFEI